MIHSSESRIHSGQWLVPSRAGIVHSTEWAVRSWEWAVCSAERAAPAASAQEAGAAGQVDQAAQRAVIDCIRAQRPDDGVLAEETLVEPEGRHRPPPENDRVCWVIDPLDGTRNYIRGIPLYACSVGAMLHGFPIAGAIYMPPHDRLFCASRAEGSFEDGRPIARRSRSPGLRPMGVALSPGDGRPSGA